MVCAESTSKKVSVYIPAYNVSEFLSEAIRGILRQTHSADEILIIDDGSNDATCEIAKSHPEVTLIRHEQNRGLAAARNTAFRASRNELVASLDADCVPDPGWLAGLLLRAGDEKIVGVGGRMVEGVQRTLADRWRCAHMAQHWGSQLVHNPLFLFGNNNLFRRSPVLEVGGYNEALRTNGEDADLCRRLLSRGWALVYDPVPFVTHGRHDSLRSILDTYWRWVFFGSPSPSNTLKLHRVIRHAVFSNFRYLFRNLLFSDLRQRHFELLGIDCIMPFYFSYREFEVWLNSRKYVGSPKT